MVSQSHVFIVWLLCSLCLSFNNNGVQGSPMLSEEEHIDLDKQLKVMNKPSVKTIKTEHGDIYDCVDFYKQPAFDHPLLKNHSFHYQMKPSSMPTSLGANEDSTNDVFSAKGFGCPFGTVPIKRVTKDDLIRAKLYSKQQHNASINSKFGENTVEIPGTHFAIVRTIYNESQTYNGLSATMSIYNPRSQPNHYSSGRIRIQNGYDFIQAGWTTNVPLYGDNDVRFYIHTKTNTIQCFNVQCPGFVLVHDYPVDSKLPASVRGGNTEFMNVVIYRDGVNGNWWVTVDEFYNSKTRNPRAIGFWPHEIFTGLMHLAHMLDWGGEVSGPTDAPSATMGSSYNITRDITLDAYMYQMGTVDYGGHMVPARNLEIFNDIGSTYTIYDSGYDTPPLVDHAIVYGGAGGYIGN